MPMAIRRADHRGGVFGDDVGEHREQRHQRGDDHHGRRSAGGEEEQLREVVGGARHDQRFAEREARRHHEENRRADGAGSGADAHAAGRQHQQRPDRIRLSIRSHPINPLCGTSRNEAQEP